MSEAASSLAAAAARGIFQGPSSRSSTEDVDKADSVEKPDMLERILDLLSTEK